MAYRGERFTIEWARDASGSPRAKEFFDGLSDSDQAKVLTLFQRLGDIGRIRNSTKFKKVADDLWEFKSYQVRLLGDYRPGRRFLIATGLKKKRDRHRPKDLEKAREILRLY